MVSWWEPGHQKCSGAWLSHFLVATMLFNVATMGVPVDTLEMEIALYLMLSANLPHGG